jgi:hypothetical protein
MLLLGTSASLSLLGIGSVSLSVTVDPANITDRVSDHMCRLRRIDTLVAD